MMNPSILMYFFIRTKDEAFEEFKSNVANSLNMKIKILRFNQGD